MSEKLHEILLHLLPSFSTYWAHLFLIALLPQKSHSQRTVGLGHATMRHSICPHCGWISDALPAPEAPQKQPWKHFPAPRSTPKHLTSSKTIEIYAGKTHWVREIHPVDERNAHRFTCPAWNGEKMWVIHDCLTGCIPRCVAQPCAPTLGCCSRCHQEQHMFGRTPFLFTIRWHRWGWFNGLSKKSLKSPRLLVVLMATKATHRQS